MWIPSFECFWSSYGISVYPQILICVTLVNYVQQRNWAVPEIRLLRISFFGCVKRSPQGSRFPQVSKAAWPQFKTVRVKKPSGSFESFRSCWDHFTMKQPLKSSKWQPWKRSFLFPSMFQMPETVQTGTERHLRAQRIGGCWSTGWWLDYSRWWAYLWHFHQPARFAWYWPIADMVSQPLDI